MRVPLPYEATKVPAVTNDQDLGWPMVVKVQRGLAPRDEKKRRCRFCDPESGQCRRLCVRKIRSEKSDRLAAPDYVLNLPAVA